MLRQRRWSGRIQKSIIYLVAHKLPTTQRRCHLLHPHTCHCCQVYLQTQSRVERESLTEIWTNLSSGQHSNCISKSVRIYLDTLNICAQLMWPSKWCLTCSNISISTCAMYAATQVWCTTHVRYLSSHVCLMQGVMSCDDVREKARKQEVDRNESRSTYENHAYVSLYMYTGASGLLPTSLGRNNSKNIKWRKSVINS